SLASRGEIRDGALIDLVCTGDPALRRLSEDLGQSRDGNNARGDDVGQYLSRSDRWQLVDVPDNQERVIVRHRLYQRLHQHDIDHGSLVHDQQVAVELIVATAFEAAPPGVDLKQPVDGLGLEAGCLGHALGGAASGCAKKELCALCREYPQYRVDDRSLANSRPASDHE